MDAAEKALAGRCMAIEPCDNVVELVANLKFLLAVRLEVCDDRRVDRTRGTVTSHLERNQ